MRARLLVQREPCQLRGARRALGQQWQRGSSSSAELLAARLASRRGMLESLLRGFPIGPKRR